MSTAELTPTKKQTVTIKSHLESDRFKETIAQALPRHLKPDRFIRVALTAMTRTPKLAQCDQHSFFQCLLTLSQLGLEPDGRRAHLIPFENRKRGVVECQLIIDYKGLVELAMRSGSVANIHADVVCENDEFEYDRGELKRHKINFKGDRGAVYAVYSLCRFKDGTEKCEVMTKKDVEAIRARSRASGSGPWVTDWNEMAKKTVFRRLSKWLPLSPEYRDALDADADSIEEKRFENAKPVFSGAALETDSFLTLPGEEDQEQETEVITERATPLQGLRNLVRGSNITEGALVSYLNENQFTDGAATLEDLEPKELERVKNEWAEIVAAIREEGN